MLAQVIVGAVIQSHAEFSANVVANAGGFVEDDWEIGDYLDVAPGAIRCGNSHISTGAHVKQGVRIGPNALIGAGVTVLSDVPAGTRMHPVETLV